MTYAATASWLRERRWVGWAVGGFVWLFWLGSLAIGGWTRDAEGQLFGPDHIAFYSAARLIRDGRAGAIYDHEKLGAIQQEITGGTWNGFTAYRNPPFYAALYVPTVGLPFPVSVLVWTVVGFAAFAFAVWCLRPARPWQVVGWSATFYPFFAAVSFAQNTLLSMAVFAAVYRLAADRRPFAAGLVAGLLWYKPQLLIGPFVWWALTVRRSWPCWLGVTVTGGVLAAVSCVALPDASRAFAESLRANVGFTGEAAWNKHTPRVFWSILLADAPLLAMTLAGVCVLASLVVTARVARRTGAPVAVMFPAAVYLSLWASPHTLIYEWALLVPAAVVLWERFPDRRDAWFCLFALAWAALAVSTVLAKVQIDAGLRVVVQVSIPVLGVVGGLAARELAATGRPAVGTR